MDLKHSKLLQKDYYINNTTYININKIIFLLSCYYIFIYLFLFSNNTNETKYVIRKKKIRKKKKRLWQYRKSVCYT